MGGTRWHECAISHPSDDGWLHRAVDIQGEMHIIEELQLFAKAQPIQGLVISSALVCAQTCRCFQILNKVQMYSCHINYSMFSCTEEYLCQLLLWTRAVTHVGLSAVHLMLWLRLRQRSVLRLGREGVRGNNFTCPEVRKHKPVV